MVRIVVLILTLLLLEQGGIAQAVRSRVDSTNFLIGDQTNLSITGAFEEAVDRVEFLKSTIDTLESIEFVNQSSVYKESVGAQTVYRRDFLVAFFDTGAYYIPGIPVVVDAGGLTDTFITAPIPIRVHAILSDSMQVAPIKPIFREPWKIWDAWPIALALAALGFLAYMIFWQRKRQMAKVEIVEIPKTPYELAIIALADLENEKYIQKGRIKEHYAQLSVILRSYLEGQFHFPALESTTREIGYGLDSVRFSTELKENVITRLHHIDLIKFAKVQPDPSDIENATDNLRKHIQEIQQSIEKEISEEE